MLIVLKLGLYLIVSLIILAMISSGDIRMTMLAGLIGWGVFKPL